MGIDLADLRKMASEAGDGTPFLVIQAIGKRRSLRLTSISRLEKATGKIGTGAPPRIAVHQSADFPPFARDARSRASVGLGMLLATSGMSACLYTVLVVTAPARS